MGLFTIPLYFDYKSAYSHLAKAEAYRLEEDYRVRLEWLPYVSSIFHSATGRRRRPVENGVAQGATDSYRRTLAAWANTRRPFPCVGRLKDLRFVSAASAYAGRLMIDPDVFLVNLKDFVDQFLGLSTAPHTAHVNMVTSAGLDTSPALAYARKTVRVNLPVRDRRKKIRSLIRHPVLRLRFATLRTNGGTGDAAIPA